MKKIIGGAIGIILGLSGISVFFPAFLTALAGTIPLLLIIGGGLTIYFKRESEPSMYDGPADCENITDSSSPVVSKETEPSEDKIQEIRPGGNIVDNVTDGEPRFLGNTGSHVFHLPDCKFSKSKNCTAVFNTSEDAIQEGYKACGICHPA